MSTTRATLFRNLSLLALVGVVAARVIALRWGADAAYWATPARLGEILVEMRHAPDPRLLGAIAWWAVARTGRARVVGEAWSLVDPAAVLRQE